MACRDRRVREEGLAGGAQSDSRRAQLWLLSADVRETRRRSWKRLKDVLVSAERRTGLGVCAPIALTLSFWVSNIFSIAFQASSQSRDLSALPAVWG
jgi:hypothetical protein